ncbi:Protein IMPACT [Penicillium macrosclerotiorum]|uniref:Protein IMPACT n=1 Tax=Penicillium macrosclerotiorum TaxID=303699 RepID=UPI0025489FDF|nr:Protein IMPACT [Penicillium macrosclerotiorum]KAJ5689232.1 Protein IMPACT [Penicillium macrosclerotiorum]
MSLLDDLPNRDLAEEIEAINAIYEPDTITVSRVAGAQPTTNNTLDLGGTVVSDDNAQSLITLQIPGQSHLSFRLGFDAAYPETRPVVLGTASTAARGEGKIAVDVLEEIVQRMWQPGAVCLFDVISEAVEVFPELSIGDIKDGDPIGAAHSSAMAGNSTQGQGANESTNSATDALAMLSLEDALGLKHPPEWILSDVVTEKKSVFLGRVVRVDSLAQAQAFLDHLTATDKKVAVATHNISAWRIKQKKESGTRVSDTQPDPEAAETVIQDYDDDGETAAGGRLLHVMQLMDVWNVLVVVSRWYGGIHLGPARFRLINDVGRDALIKGSFTREESPGVAEKSKKKGKK